MRWLSNSGVVHVSTAMMHSNVVVNPYNLQKPKTLGTSVRVVCSSHRTAQLKVVCTLQQKHISAPHCPTRTQVDDQQGLDNLIAFAGKLPNQADQLCNPSDRTELEIALVEPSKRSVADLDYLTELLAIQQSDGPKNLGFFGTRNMGMTHQKLVEILGYAMVSAGNHIYTSGATGTNAAVIKGALRAEQPDLLTVILPQSLSRQPTESQELLAQVQNVIEMPQHDHMSLMDSSSAGSIATPESSAGVSLVVWQRISKARYCNREIISKVQQVICFAFHDSRLLLETCAEAKEAKKIVTLFYLD